MKTRLYKYKSLTDFEFVADILINKRLYAAHYKELNDPLEGAFSPDEDTEYNKLIEKKMDEIRVCSLSTDMNNPLLWAHYADGFKGVCIEIEVDESVLELRKINYTPFDVLPSRNYKGMFGDEDEVTPEEWAKSSLSGKYEDWEYEKEYRILSDSKFIKDGFRITGVYLGTRVSKLYQKWQF